MVEKLAFWIESVIEDDPMPEEIDIILFNVRKNGLYKYLEIRGYEKYIGNSLSYYPLEAQFFECNELARLNDTLFRVRAKNLIEEAFSSIILKQQLNNKKIYFKFNDKIEYLFNV